MAHWACRWIPRKRADGRVSRRFISPATPPPSPPPGGGAAKRGKAQPQQERQLVPGAGKQRRAPAFSRLRGLSAHYLKLFGCGPGHASTPNVTSPTSGPQRVPGPGSRVPVCPTLGIPRPVRLSRREGEEPHARRLAQARTSSTRTIPQFRHREDREGKGHPDDVMFGGGAPFCEPYTASSRSRLSLKKRHERLRQPGSTRG